MNQFMTFTNRCHAYLRKLNMDVCTHCIPGPCERDPDEPCHCSMEWDPWCCGGTTYTNKCHAMCDGIDVGSSDSGCYHGQCDDTTTVDTTQDDGRELDCTQPYTLPNGASWAVDEEVCCEYWVSATNMWDDLYYANMCEALCDGYTIGECQQLDGQCSP